MENKEKMANSTAARLPVPPIPSPAWNPKVRCCHLPGCCSAQLMFNNHKSFKSCASPVRFMFNHGESWVYFQSDVNASLRSRFVEGKALTEVEIEGAKYVFDFLRMVQIDLGSGNQRSIAWIDENRKAHFPKVYVCEESMDGMEKSRKLKNAVEIPGNGHADKRKSEDNGKGAEVASLAKKNTKQENEVNGSKRQRLTPTYLGTSKWPKAACLSEKEDAYLFARNLFLKSGITNIDRGATITSIYQYEFSKPSETARWEDFERQIQVTKAARGVANIVYAWYSASAEEVVATLTHGFRLPAHGVGLYLSSLRSCHLSAMPSPSEADNNGEKHYVLCRVILGNIENVEAGSQQGSPCSVDFDTGADDPKNPKWYLVWSTNMNKQILPECVVSYKSFTPNPGELRSSGGKCSLARLLSIMKKHLPPSKLGEFIDLYDNIESGKLPREKFFEELRAITGDKVLRSIVKEIDRSG